jgi:AraC-like DNA-binding protein
MTRARRATQERGISSAIVMPVLRALEQAGLDLEAHVPALLGEAQEEFVVGAAVDQSLNDAAERLGDPALGITLARRIPIGALGLIDYALCTSASLREALGTVARHYGVATQRVRLTLLERDGLALLAFERLHGIEHSRHWIEFSFAILADRMRSTLGQQVVFEEVAFAHEAPAVQARHDEFFGVPVQFSQPDDHFGFSVALLDLPLRTASRSLAELLADRLREIEPAVGDPFLARAQRVVVELLDQGECGLAAAAAGLRCSARTLQRRLATLGTSHRGLLDDVRRERSVQLLGQNQFSVADVAAKLGFSETSAFFRAFRRWTGTSPHNFRHRLTKP